MPSRCSRLSPAGQVEKAEPPRRAPLMASSASCGACPSSACTAADSPSLPAQLEQSCSCRAARRRRCAQPWSAAPSSRQSDRCRRRQGSSGGSSACSSRARLGPRRRPATASVRGTVPCSSAAPNAHRRSWVSATCSAKGSPGHLYGTQILAGMGCACAHGMQAVQYGPACCLDARQQSGRYLAVGGTQGQIICMMQPAGQLQVPAPFDMCRLR